MLDFNKKDMQLAFHLFRMNMRDRYLGSTLGGFWAIANPLFMLILYTFVFGFILKVRLPGVETTWGYVIWLISGYGPWIATSEAIMASTTSVVGAAGVVKNIAFKTELLPLAASLGGVISLGVSLLFLIVATTITNNVLDWRVLWLPVIAVLQFSIIAALGLWLSAINVFVRDLSIALPNLLTILMFITPIFYPIKSMPLVLQKLCLVNPFYLITDAYREVLLNHSSPNMYAMFYILILSMIIFYFGLSAFRRVKGNFDSAL